MKKVSITLAAVALIIAPSADLHVRFSLSGPDLAWDGSGFKCGLSTACHGFLTGNWPFACNT